MFVTTIHPSTLDHAPLPKGQITHVLNTITSLAAQGLVLAQAVYHRAIAAISDRTHVGAFLRIAGAVNRLIILQMCLESPQPPPPPRKPRTQPAKPAKPRPNRRPRPAPTPQTEADHAIRAMRRQLEVRSVTEIMITLARDLGILPDFDDWPAPAPAPTPARSRPPSPPDPAPLDRFYLPSFELSPLVPLHPSG